MYPTCVRKALERGMDGNRLKPFTATQRVQPPPGKGGARQPEASLAWASVTAFVKRRQRALKPCGSLEIMCCGSLCLVGCWGSIGQAVMARPADSAGVLEQGIGAGWAAREPERSRTRPCETAGFVERRLTNAPGPRAGLATRRSADEANTKTPSARGTPKRIHKLRGMRAGMS